MIPRLCKIKSLQRPTGNNYENYKKLKDLSLKYNAPFLFETNVGAGLPIIDTLNNLIYSIDLMVVKDGVKVLANIKEVLLLEGIEDKRDGDWLGDFPGMIRPTYFPWSKEKNNE